MDPPNQRIACTRGPAWCQGWKIPRRVSHGVETGRQFEPLSLCWEEMKRPLALQCAPPPPPLLCKFFYAKYVFVSCFIRLIGSSQEGHVAFFASSQFAQQVKQHMWPHLAAKGDFNLLLQMRQYSIQLSEGGCTVFAKPRTATSVVDTETSASGSAFSNSTLTRLASGAGGWSAIPSLYWKRASATCETTRHREQW